MGPVHGNWVNEDGNKETYLNWLDGEPNNHGEAGKNLKPKFHVPKNPFRGKKTDVCHFSHSQLIVGLHGSILCVYY